MLSPDNSKMLARKRQIAIYNKDFDMLKKIENIQKDNEITKDIINYKQISA